jgi:hypothetical protein
MDRIVEALIAAALLVIPALGAWLVSWLRAHTTASAVRQATDMAGGSPEAVQLAADELHRMPWLMRPANVPRAVERAVEKERAVRASKVPPPLPRDTMPDSLPQVDDGSDEP